jgi:conjugal transfer pilus assembly protein TraL
MNHPSSLLVPRKLDAPPRFLLWDFDSVAAGIGGMGVGICLNSFVFGCCMSVALSWGWTRLKAGRHPGFGLHWLYWRSPVGFFKRTPASCHRFFVG